MSVEIPDTLEERQGPAGSKPGVRATILAVGLVLVMSVGVGVLSRQPADEKGTSSPAEDTAVSVPPLNDPLIWVAGEVGSTWPHGVVEFEGSLYFFAASLLPSTRNVGVGLDAWLLVDGVTWKSLGTVIDPPNQIHVVSGTPQGLVATGTGEGGALRVWSSIDAVEWRESIMPAAPAEVESLYPWAQAIGGNDEVIVVFASSSPDVDGLVRDLLPGHLPADDFEAPLGISWGGPPWEVDAYGPLGINVFSATAEELGLSDDEAQALFGQPEAGSTTAWASHDGETWAPIDIGIDYVYDIAEVGGDLIVRGYGASDETWISSNGFDWERETSREAVEHLAQWRGGFVASQQWTSVPDIVYSEDRLTWESLGVQEYLADDHTWWVQTVAASEKGVAVLISGFAEREDSYTEPRPLVIERDGFTLTVDWMGSGSMSLTSGEDELLHLFGYSEQAHEEVVVDFTSRKVTFLDPASAEPLVSFTFDEIEQAEADAYQDDVFMQEERILAFSADGVTWSIENLAETFGAAAYVNSIHVTQDQVIAVVTEYEEVYNRVPQAPKVVIWTAVIP